MARRMNTAEILVWGGVERNRFKKALQTIRCISFSDPTSDTLETLAEKINDIDRIAKEALNEISSSHEDA